METPQQNGIVEQKHQHILNIARAINFQANLPRKFWGDCILTTTHIINWTSTTILDDKSPYEMLYQTKASYTHLRVFVCLCYASTLKRNCTKFDPRAIPCVLDIPMVWKRINYIIFKLILPLFHGMCLFMKPYFFFIILNSWNFSLAPPILLIMINSYYQLNHISQLIIHSQFPLICIFGLYHCLIIFPTNITCSKWRSHFIRSTWGYFIWFQFIWTTISTTCHSFPQVR